jgi:hypothetical protein
MDIKTCLGCVHYQHDNRDPGGAQEEGRKVSPAEILGRWRWQTHLLVPAAATVASADTPKVGPGERREIERVLLRNRDSAASVCVISIVEAGDVLEIYSQALAAANTWYPIQLQVDLFPNEFLRYSWSSCVAADDLDVKEAGRVRDLGEWVDGMWHASLAAEYGLETPEGE